MTSRDRSWRGFEDQLDAMIGWALREGVADAIPPRDAWQQINARLRAQTETRRTAWWRGFCLACRSLSMWLLEPAMGPSDEYAYCQTRDLMRMRDKHHLCLLIYQYDLPMLLGQAV